MNLEKYKECVLKPISKDNPIGVALIDDADAEFIDNQMIKVGTLSHSSIQWNKVATLSAKILAEKSKDLKIFIALIKSINHNLSPASLITSFDLINIFIDSYWQNFHPSDINNNAAIKGKYFNQILRQLLIVAEKIDYSTFSKEQGNKLINTLNLLKTTIDKYNLRDAIFDKLINKVEQGIKTAPEKNTEKKQTSEKEIEQNSIVSTVVQTKTKVERKADILSKDYLQEVAQKLANDERLIPLSIRLKRHVLWQNISVPPYNADKKTLLKPLDPNRLNDYYLRFNDADLALWQQIEHSITLAPFWFEGQWISYHVALQLKQVSWCEAILQETSAFLTRIPILQELCFADGTPLISEKVQNWLNLSVAEQNAINNLEEKWQRLIDIYQKESFSSALAYINDHLQKATEPREKAHWQFFNIKLLAENQLTLLAKEEAQTLLTFISQMKIEEWEPSLVKKLQYFANAQ